jgi:hypothetical protein
MIRPLREDDDLQSLLGAWVQECNSDDFGLTIDTQKVDEDLKAVAQGTRSTVLALEKGGLVVGILGLVAFPSAMGPEQIANEHYWYVMPEHRGYLRSFITYARSWARTMACSHLMLNASYMASDRCERVGELYKKMGLKPFENVFITEV